MVYYYFMYFNWNHQNISSVGFLLKQIKLNFIDENGESDFSIYLLFSRYHLFGLKIKKSTFLFSIPIGRRNAKSWFQI